MKYLRQVYSQFDRKFKKNIKRLIIVHPTSWMKTIWMLFKPIISAKFGQKVTYVNYLSKLFIQTLESMNHKLSTLFATFLNAKKVN